MVAPIKLPRLAANARLIDENGYPTILFSSWWGTVATQVETALNAIIAIPEIQAALVSIDAATAAAQAAATAANTAAGNAQASADGAVTQTSLQGSYPDPSTVLSATDTGTAARINVAAHTRRYSDGTSVAVSAGNVTGLAYNTLYYAYYSDSNHTGGAVTYLATTSQAVAAQVGAIHTVGSITTPVAAAPPTTGAGVRPPGIGTIP